MKIKEFETFLENKSREEETQNKVDWEARKNEWLESLEKFYEKIDHWLKVYLISGKIKMHQEDVTIQEEHIGTYTAASRVIKIGADRVYLRPIGTLLIGTRGRIDMEGPKGTARFVLTGKRSSGISISISEPPKKAPKQAPAEECVWKIATPPPQVKFIELTTESFLQSLMEVVDG